MSLHSNLDDIQGNILAGFNCEIELLIGLSADSLETQQSACRWVSGLTSEVSSVNDVNNQRSRMRNRATTRGMSWLCVSISKRVLDTQSDVFIRDNAFNGGLIGRAPSLGDRSDPC